jgi:hypothetical protein
MDPLVISSLISAGMRVYADIMDRNSRGEITDADIELMLATLGTKLDAWQAKIDAHQAGA